MTTMSSKLTSLTLCIAVLLAVFGQTSTTKAQADAQVTRRFALIVGANHGGRARETLRYAQRDAKAVAAVLEQLGGVERGDRVLLLEPSPEQLKLALDDLKKRAAAARESRQRTELLFYYSGHSDERGLLLGEQRVPYREVRDGLVSVGTAVHVGVLDSCSSGALTRMKGGQRRAPFLLDNSNEVQGHAFLTSSSADEGAQESDRVGASFFTHYLVSGLRGAADFSGDGRVTLNEAYRFAFDETLAQTEDTRAGPQHAAYDIQLVGTGDLVMTDLREPAAAMSIPKEVTGRLYVRDSKGNLVVELNKPQGRVIELALDADTYQILLDRDGVLSRASIKLPANTTTRLDMRAFSVVEGERNRLRGDDLAPAPAPYKLVPVGIGLIPPVSTNEVYGLARRDAKVKIRNIFALHLGMGRAHRLDGVAFALGGNVYHEEVHGVQGAVGFNYTRKLLGAQLGVGYHQTDYMRGVQSGAGLSVVRGRFEGGQLDLVNLANEGLGIQLGLANGAYKLSGLQGGLLNLSRETHGAQLGLVNLAQNMKGAQIGLFNLATDSKSDGFQTGLLNISQGRVRGLQLGLVNYAERATAQFGLLSMTREGGVHPLLYATDVIAIQTGLRFDADYTYSTLIAGIQPQAGGDAYAMGFGFGGKVPVPPVTNLTVEPELSYQTLFLNGTFKNGNPSTYGRLALHARYQLYKHLSFFGGPAYSVIIHNQDKFHGERPGIFNGKKVLGTAGKNDSTQFLGMVGLTLGVSL